MRTWIIAAVVTVLLAVGLIIDTQDPCRGVHVDLLECEVITNLELGTWLTDAEKELARDEVRRTFEDIADELGRP